MNIHVLRHIGVIAALAFAVCSNALDLPIKKVRGQEVYYYKVENKESVYGISKKLGVSREDIVRHNPSVADGVKRGMMLYFPVSEFKDAMPEEEVAAVTEEVVAEADTIVEQTPKRSSIALLLPFGLESNEPTRINRLALDFYKGFLLGADTLAERTGNVAIDVFDTESRPVESLLEDPAVAEAAIIVAPNNKDALSTIAAIAAERGNYVLNTFVVADTLYSSNPFVLQANTPQRQMYKLAVDALMDDFEGFTPVVLRNTTGKNEKESFVAYMTQRYAERGIEPLVIEYENNLLMSNLETLPVDQQQRYVLIPTSGSLAEFNKFAYVVKSLRDRLLVADIDAEEFDPLAPKAEVALFGYPDWTAFRGDALDTLHKLEVTVYSRFFDNFSGFATRSLESDFKRWYGTEIIESVPSQAILGYDTACFLIKNLRANQGEFNPVYPQRYDGIQSTYDFDKTDQGYYNASIYILKYLPGGQITERTI